MAVVCVVDCLLFIWEKTWEIALKVNVYFSRTPFLKCTTYRVGIIFISTSSSPALGPPNLLFSVYGGLFQGG
jgi:hypothetical protein